ncbi:MAG: methyltransferase domain-containing protein [Candidatus Omnitrophica bacterium]|nr:methyltransferase domain-containing protein [Candidatus Omnitrophota bacterium]
MILEQRCHLCGSDSFQVMYEPGKSEPRKDPACRITDHEPDSSLRVVTCRRCGLSFLNPHTEDCSVKDGYVNMADDKYVREAAGRRKAARLVLRRLRKYKSGGRLLDIGCATGFLMDEAAKLGWEVQGVELSQWGVDYARHQLGLKNVFQGSLSDANFPRAYFDAVIMTDVIEHLPDPKAVLRDVRLILKPDGVFCCTTPDIDSTVSKLLKAKWWGIKRLHYYYFNRKTLGKLFAASGFTSLAMGSHARTFSLGYWFTNLADYMPAMKRVAAFIARQRGLAAFSICFDLGDQLVAFARRSREMKYLPELEYEPQEKSPVLKKKVIVVLPAYNAAKTLAVTVKDIPRAIVDDIILVDDHSTDNTAEVARQLGVKVIRHERNKGYGGNQKTCYHHALELGAEVVVMVHPDYQYDPTEIPRLVEPIIKGKADAVFGSRMMKGGALVGGMPNWKYNANILLTALENVVLGIYLTEYHSGFRAYSRAYLNRVNFAANSDGFVFDTEIIVQGVLKFMRFEEVPIRTRYFDEASSIKLWPSIVYGLNILKTLIKFQVYKLGWRFRQFD